MLPPPCVPPPPQKEKPLLQLPVMDDLCRAPSRTCAASDGLQLQVRHSWRRGRRIGLRARARGAIGPRRQMLKQPCARTCGRRSDALHRDKSPSASISSASFHLVNCRSKFTPPLHAAAPPPQDDSSLVLPPGLKGRSSRNSQYTRLPPPPPLCSRVRADLQFPSPPHSPRHWRSSLIGCPLSLTGVD